MIVDLFAGPGGWSEGLRSLGLRDVGVELDAAACATRAAAGHLTIRADVASLRPPERLDGLIASPPCTAFSRAGLKEGAGSLDELAAAILAGDWLGPRERLPVAVWLPLEVGRWADASQPDWIAAEQVPACLPLWNAYAARLSEQGYSTWAGVLNAADYGVPQVRRRAVLLASRSVEVAEPPRTHREHVTMAAALGWAAGCYPPRNDQSGPCPNLDWPWQRASTTIAGRPLATDPGANANRFNGATKSRNDGYRITIEEALVLQGFPADYPVRGEWAAAAPQLSLGLGAEAERTVRSSAFQQIGNAIPPPLAARCVEPLL